MVNHWESDAGGPGGEKGEYILSTHDPSNGVRKNPQLIVAPTLWYPPVSTKDVEVSIWVMSC